LTFHPESGKALCTRAWIFNLQSQSASLPHLKPIRHLKTHYTMSLLFRRPALGLRATPSILPIQARFLHVTLEPPAVPKPTPTVPDVSTFLTKIGRNTVQHADKFPTWEEFFKFSTKQFRELGIEPARDRRYILRFREKFRVLATGQFAGDPGVILKEEKRPKKIDGGERRKAEVRHNRAAEERKNARKE
jgi:hypothetical protein